MWRHDMDLVRARVDERLFAENINDPRDAARMKVNRIHGIRLEQRLAFGPANLQTVLNIIEGLVTVERRCLAMGRYPLLQVAHPNTFKFLFQFKLARQHDLQQLLPRSLQVKQHANLLERAEWQALRLVHEQDRRLAAAMALHQPALEAFPAIDCFAGLAGD